MVEIEIEYSGQLRCQAVHGPSRRELETDAPLDNHGRGESFSPTDLVATALGTCMLTVMGIRARKGGYRIDGTRARVEKTMSSEGPRRISQLAVEVDVVGQGLDSSRRVELEHAANTCPVRLSLLEAIAVPVRFSFPDEPGDAG